jgi:transposase
MRRRRSAANRFNKPDQWRLEKFLKQVVEARSYRRVKAVLLVATGVIVSKVAQIIGVSRPSIHGWIRRYLKRRAPEDLQDAPRSGRPLAARTITNARIACEFRRDPLRLGYNTTGWTVALLATHLSKRYGCKITARTLRRRVKQMELRWSEGGPQPEEWPEKSPILVLGLACLTSYRFSSTFPSEEKAHLKLLYSAFDGGGSPTSQTSGGALTRRPATAPIHSPRQTPAYVIGDHQSETHKATALLVHGGGQWQKKDGKNLDSGLALLRWASAAWASLSSGRGLRHPTFSAFGLTRR